MPPREKHDSRRENNSADINDGKEFTNNKASFDSPLLSLLCEPHWDLWDAYQSKLSPVSLNPRQPVDRLKPPKAI